MRIEVSSRWKKWIAAATWTVALGGIVAAFFTLPVPVAVGVAIGLGGVGYLLNRIVFRHVGVLVMAGPTETMERYWAGTAWIGDSYQPSETPCFALLYLNRSAARDAHHMLMTWSFGKRVDKAGHVVLSVVDEGSGKYSIFLVPGERAPAVEGVSSALRDAAGPRSVVEVRTVKFFILNCVDYSSRDEPNRLMQSLPYREYVELQVGYVDGGDISFYVKQPFRLSAIRYRQRSELVPRDFEHGIGWRDLASQTPKHVLDLISEVMGEQVSSSVKCGRSSSGASEALER